MNIEIISSTDYGACAVPNRIYYRRSIERGINRIPVAIERRWNDTRENCSENLEINIRICFIMIHELINKVSHDWVEFLLFFRKCTDCVPFITTTINDVFVVCREFKESRRAVDAPD